MVWWGLWCNYDRHKKRHNHHSPAIISFLFLSNVCSCQLLKCAFLIYLFVCFFVCISFLISKFSFEVGEKTCRGASLFIWVPFSMHCSQDSHCIQSLKGHVSCCSGHSVCWILICSLSSVGMLFQNLLPQVLVLFYFLLSPAWVSSTRMPVFCLSLSPVHSWLFSKPS